MHTTTSEKKALKRQKKKIEALEFRDSTAKNNVADAQKAYDAAYSKTSYRVNPFKNKDAAVEAQKAKEELDKAVQEANVAKIALENKKAALQTKQQEKEKILAEEQEKILAEEQAKKIVLLKFYHSSSEAKVAAAQKAYNIAYGKTSYKLNPFKNQGASAEAQKAKEKLDKAVQEANVAKTALEQAKAGAVQ